MTHTHTHTYLLPTYQESFWSCASREPERVFSLKASQMGIRVCARLLFVCVCPFMRGRAARTGDFLCWGRERLGHFIFSSVHCQKGQRSKVRAIGEFRAACRQIGFQGWGRVTDQPGGIGACVRAFVSAFACVHICMYLLWGCTCTYLWQGLFRQHFLKRHLTRALMLRESGSCSWCSLLCRSHWRRLTHHKTTPKLRSQF